MKRKTQEQFLLECKEKANKDLDLSSFIYVNKRTKSSCRCHACGHSWLATPDSVLTGRGCNLCGYKKSTLKKTFTTEQFINHAIKAHGNKYNYEKVVYINTFKKVKISCFKHGEFEQATYAHRYGQGCPKCYGKQKKQAYINLIFDCDICVGVKFGIASNFKTRLNSQNNKSKFNVVNLGVWVFSDSSDCFASESKVKSLTKPVMSKLEMPDGHTETSSSSKIEMIKGIYEEFGGVRLFTEEDL